MKHVFFYYFLWLPLHQLETCNKFWAAISCHSCCSCQFSRPGWNDLFCTAIPNREVQGFTGKSYNENRDPEMRTGTLQWEQGSPVMKTGFSLWEWAHREFPVSLTGFGFAVLVSWVVRFEAFHRACVKVLSLLDGCFDLILSP